MVDQVPDPDPIAGWLEILEESEADLAAGRTVSGEALLRELRESAERIEARIAAKRALEVKPRR